MNDTDELQARSIELAERSLRLRDRAMNDQAKEGLHAAANELIMFDNLKRFYDAQSALEKQNSWLEDQRSLAHEINVADRMLRGTQPLDALTAFRYVEQWANQYITSSQAETAEIGRSLNASLDTLTEAAEAAPQKQALNYIISVIEALLEHIAQGGGATANETVLLFRAMRDSALVARELAYDEDDLLVAYKEEGEVIDRLTIARHTLDELYKTIQEPKIV